MITRSDPFGYDALNVAELAKFTVAGLANYAVEELAKSFGSRAKPTHSAESTNRRVSLPKLLASSATVLSEFRYRSWPIPLSFPAA